jgi:dTDP-4-amino-4,6-dideoxygalactose transaminase
MIMPEMRIPYNRPCFEGKELVYIAKAIDSCHISGDGLFTERCQSLLQDLLAVPRVLLTTSCTHALEMAALLLDLQPGDEVIVPSFTFVSTANAFALHGGRPAFVDVRPDTLNLDENLLEALVTPRTRAIVPVHYAGIACEMDTILSIAERHGISVIEDNAHGFLGRYKGRYLGTLGSMAAQSFHETKNVMCGEGGALLLNDPAYILRAEIVRQKGTDRSRFLRGEVDKYTWVDVGSSYAPADILAAFLYAQLEARDHIQEHRRVIWTAYYNGLEKWARERGVILPTVPRTCQPTYHLFYLLMPSLEERQALIAHLRKQGILSVFHFQPLHISKMGQRFGGKPGDCPVAESVSDRLVRLPFYNQLTEEEQESVIQAVHDFRMP